MIVRCRLCGTEKAKLDPKLPYCAGRDPDTLECTPLHAPHQWVEVDEPPQGFTVYEKVPQGGTRTLQERFPMGSYFLTDHKAWKVTDTGSRVIVAIEHRPGSHEEPPYSVEEIVFDEYDLPACRGPVRQEPGKTMDETIAGLLPPLVNLDNTDWTVIYATNPEGPPPIDGGPYPADEVVNMTLGSNLVVRRLAQEVLWHRWHDCENSQGSE